MAAMSPPTSGVFFLKEYDRSKGSLSSLDLVKSNQQDKHTHKRLRVVASAAVGCQYWDTVPSESSLFQSRQRGLKRRFRQLKKFGYYFFFSRSTLGSV